MEAGEEGYGDEDDDCFLAVADFELDCEEGKRVLAFGSRLYQAILGCRQ